MIRPYHTIASTLLFVSVLLLFSGCADTIRYSAIDRLSLAAVDDDSAAADTDQDLQATEQEMCLDEELKELSLTGMWNGADAPMSLDPTLDTTFEFPVVFNKQVQMYLEFFQKGFRNQFAEWLRRSAVYVPMMETALSEAGLPRDLVYLAMIESGYNPFACSRSNAVGIWQFMEGTGQQYNLTIDRYLDERRDPEKSTQAAVAFLSDLYKEFGDWHLAVAAYNGGPNKIRIGLSKYKVDNFWDLAEQEYLALETKRYVPKLIAALIIARQPEKFGFTGLEPLAPPKFDLLTTPPGMGLDAIALLTNSPKETIKKLNPQLRQDRVPLNTSGYEVKVPANTAALAMKNMPRLHSTVTTAYKTHKIRKTDTLASIAASYDINRTTLLKANNLRSGKLNIGQNLRIPYNTVSYQLLPENIAKARAAGNEGLVMHRVKSGETLSRVATQYGVSPETILAWNNIKNPRSLQVGTQLALYLDNRAASAPATRTEPIAMEKPATQGKSDRMLVLKADKRKIHITEASAADALASYRVQNGDTLYSISQKVNISTSEIKKWNNLKSDTIIPGDVLKLKKA